MIRAWTIVLAVGMAFAAAGNAQSPAGRFHWQTGQILSYAVEQSTTVSETLSGDKFETTQKINLVKRWQVLNVDAAGVATLQMSLSALRSETKTPRGDVIAFDSAAPEKSEPKIREEMAKYVGVPLAVLRLDTLGRVIEVKESKFGPASRYDSEPPFVVVLTPAGMQPGQAWERNYTITIEPPQGTGEKFEAVQKYDCKSVQNGAATLSMTTVMKSLPKTLTEQEPLLRLQPEGEVVFDLQSGRLHSARLKVNKELKNHQGEGTSYSWQSSYVEQYVENR